MRVIELPPDVIHKKSTPPINFLVRRQTFVTQLVTK